MKKSFSEEVRVVKNSPRQSLCITGFRYQLRDIIQQNLSEIFDYSEYRKKNIHSCFNCVLCPPVEVKQNRELFINLILMFDGVNIKKTTLRKQLWPVWLQIADLPPRRRSSRQHIVLAALFVGFTIPNYTDIVPLLNAELISSVQVRFKGFFFKTFFKVKLLIADLGAKSHMLNMYIFNGSYGCHFCTLPGKTIGSTHSYYPFPQTVKTREHCVNDMLVNYAELLPVDGVINVAGVKGKSAFASMSDDLPLTAPVDYMHCFSMGVFPEILKLCNRALCTNDRTEVGLILSKLSCPREIVAYSRKIRSLDEIAQFKASEYFNWIFVHQFFGFP